MCFGFINFENADDVAKAFEALNGKKFEKKEWSWPTILYGQAPLAIIPPQASFGYQQQLVPGMRPSGLHVPNFIVSMQSMLLRGRVYLYPPSRNMPEVPMSSVGGGMLYVPYDMGGIPLRDAGIGQPVPIPTLATALANATPEQQMMMLGECLYPLVEKLERDSAAKVTGMLLEMDQTEVLHLLSH
ncbi:hypothetical protein REPUB_Repub07fG0128800 [Reevesia pubescens]